MTTRPQTSPIHSTHQHDRTPCDQKMHTKYHVSWMVAPKLEWSSRTLYIASWYGFDDVILMMITVYVRTTSSPRGTCPVAGYSTVARFIVPPFKLQSACACHEFAIHTTFVVQFTHETAPVAGI